MLHSDARPERRPPSPDVIVLSDNEQPASPRVNGLPKEVVDTSTEALLVSGRPAEWGVVPSFPQPPSPLPLPHRRAAPRSERE